LGSGARRAGWVWFRPLSRAATSRRSPEQILETIGYLDRTTASHSPFAPLTAMPSGITSPEVWLLGSSDYGAALAADLGLPYAYAHFISSDAPALTAAYRQRFRPSARNTQPRVAIALAALIAPTDEEAATLALPIALWRMRLLHGSAGPFSSLEEAQNYPWTPLERHEVARTARMTAGSPQTVRRRIETIVEQHEADEVVVVTIAPDYASRLRSYELLAEAFALERPAVQLTGTSA